MNKRFGMMALLFLALPVMAHASCDDVKSSIDAKIKANGVSNYKLDVVSSDSAGADAKVVGTCEGDKKIVYTKGDGGSASSDSASTDSSAPADASSAPAKPMHHHMKMKKPADDSAAPAPATSSGG